MKRVISGSGVDTTSQVVAWLQSASPLNLANLYLIGDWGHPQALYLTDWEAPLAWPMVGTFLPSVIRRGTVSSKIGLDVQNLQIDWSAKNHAYGTTVQTASPYQLARMGFYDNWPVRVWTCYMPTPGDAMTFGCSELFGGRVANVTVNRGLLTLKVNSFLDVVNQQVPTNVIELMNTAAAYQGASPPKGFSQIPQFVVEEGSSKNVVVGYQVSPNPGGILDDNIVRGGFLVFNTVPDNASGDPPTLGSTLGGVWSAIQQNTKVNTGGSSGGGGLYNQFILYAPLPWPPQSAHDSFYISGPSPINKEDGDYFGFPWIPAPETAV